MEPPVGFLDGRLEFLGGASGDAMNVEEGGA